MSLLAINNFEQINFSKPTERFGSNNLNNNYIESSQSKNCCTDSFQQEKNNYKKNLEELKKNGGYYPEEKQWFGTKKAQYKYIATGRETLGDIKKKFNLKDGAIRRCDKYLKDDDHVPEKGKEIFFYEEDVKKE